MTEEPQDHERRHWQTVEVAHHASHLAGRLREAENAIGRFLSECQEFERHATEVGIRLSSHPSLPGTSWQPAIQVERWNEYDPEQRSAIVHALYLRRDQDLAKRVAYAWAGLSRACHQHAYELPPTADELAGWIDTVEQLIPATA